MEPPQVLIIEDDRDTADFFSTVLKLFGYEYEIITNAKTALARLASCIPEIILLDIHLGQEIGGDDILFQIRSNPRLDHARVIVITAHMELARPVMDLADLVLTKPIAIEQLSVFIQRLSSFEMPPRKFTFRDPISALFTREFFITRLELAYERSKRRPNFLFAVLLLQLELSSGNNEDIQSDAIRPILREAGQRIRTHIRPTDTAARMGEWTLGTLHEDLSSIEDMEVIRERLSRNLSQTFVIQKKEYLFKVEVATQVHRGEFTSPLEILELAQNGLKSP